MNDEELIALLAALAFFAPAPGVTVEPFRRAVARAFVVLEERDVKLSPNEIHAWTRQWPVA